MAGEETVEVLLWLDRRQEDPSSGGRGDRGERREEGG